jgi:hypothetical protein
MTKPKETVGDQSENVKRDKSGKFAKGGKPVNGFKPGQSGNPKGRRDAISDIVRKIIDADEGAIKKALTEKLIANAQLYDGDDFLKYFDRIKEWTEGKSTQPTADVSDGWQKFLDGVFEPEQK